MVSNTNPPFIKPSALSLFHWREKILVLLICSQVTGFVLSLWWDSIYIWVMVSTSRNLCIYLVHSPAFPSAHLTTSLAMQKFCCLPYCHLSLSFCSSSFCCDFQEIIILSVTRDSRAGGFTFTFKFLFHFEFTCTCMCGIR